MPRQGVGTILPSPQTSTCPWVAAQTTDVFGGNRLLLLHGHGFRCGPRWQYRPEPHHGLWWHHWLLRSSCSSLPSSLELCLSSLSPHLFLFLFCFFTTYLLHIVIPRVSWYLESSQECYACPCSVAPERRHLKHITHSYTAVL